MIALAFKFLAGRYHATGWDHHVNEGTVEWPPSPWRILRAIVAASHRIDCDRTRLAELLERLVEPPVYHLPPTAPAHLRHYMPTDDESTTKVFDAFLAVGGGAADPGELQVVWPVDLAPADAALLASVVAQIPYLGRAESWVEARLVDAPASQPNAWPRTASSEEAATTTRLLAPLPTRDYHLWRDGYLAAQDPRTARKLALPDTLWDILRLDTGALQQAGWSAPPGTRWVDYSVGVARPCARVSSAPTRSTPPPDYARIVFDSAVLPRVEDTLWIGEKLRAALLSRLGDEHSPALLGKDPAGRPLSGHRHAYFLPQADAAGFVTQVVIYARGGLDPEAVRALRSLQRLYRKGEALTNHPTYTTLVALGHLRSLEQPPPPLRRGRVWESATPFVPPRCPKRRGDRLRDSPEDQLRWLCRETLDVEPARVTELDPEQSRERRLHWFRRARRRGAAPAGQPRGYGFRVEFSEDVSGPIALGYGAHFGLGQFTSIR